MIFDLSLSIRTCVILVAENDVIIDDITASAFRALGPFALGASFDVLGASVARGTFALYGTFSTLPLSFAFDTLTAARFDCADLISLW